MVLMPITDSSRVEVSVDCVVQFRKVAWQQMTCRDYCTRNKCGYTDQDIAY